MSLHPVEDPEVWAERYKIRRDPIACSECKVPFVPSVPIAFPGYRGLAVAEHGYMGAVSRHPSGSFRLVRRKKDSGETFNTEGLLSKPDKKKILRDLSNKYDDDDGDNQRGGGYSDGLGAGWKACAKSQKSELDLLRARVKSFKKVLQEMECDCGFEVQVGEGYQGGTCWRCEALEADRDISQGKKPTYYNY